MSILMVFKQTHMEKLSNCILDISIKYASFKTPVISFRFQQLVLENTRTARTILVTWLRALVPQNLSLSSSNYVLAIFFQIDGAYQSRKLTLQLLNLAMKCSLLTNLLSDSLYLSTLFVGHSPKLVMKQSPLITWKIK